MVCNRAWFFTLDCMLFLLHLPVSFMTTGRCHTRALQFDSTFLCLQQHAILPSMIFIPFLFFSIIHLQVIVGFLLLLPSGAQVNAMLQSFAWSCHTIYIANHLPFPLYFLTQWFLANSFTNIPPLKLRNLKRFSKRGTITFGSGKK